MGTKNKQEHSEYFSIDDEDQIFEESNMNENFGECLSDCTFIQ
jgi:hypothetical protein